MNSRTPPVESAFPPACEKHAGLFLALAFLIPFVWLCVIRPPCMGNGEISADAYYHVAMAELGPSVFCAKTFPWLELSVWRDTFADKELLYHFALWGIVRTQEFLGLNTDAPFHLPAVVFMGISLLAFLYTMKRLGVSPPLILAMSILMPLAIPNFTFRFLMLRPHVLSLAFLLLLIAMLSKGSLRSRSFWTLGISFFYTWSYSNPQFILIPAAVFALVGFREDSWKSLWIFAAAVAGVLLGLLIHPQFPNSFLIWKVQSWDALFGPMMSDGAAKNISLMPPKEMMSPMLSWHKIAIPFYVFSYFTFLCLARLIEFRGFSSLPSHVIAIAILSLLFTGGIFVVQRTIEYAAPFTVLLAGLVFDRALKEKIFLPWRDRPMKFCLALTLLAIAMACFSSVMNISISRGTTPPAKEIGEWMGKNLPENAVLVNLNWGDFPTIFHANRKQVYLWGMDPAFSIAANPKKTRDLERLLLAPEHLTPRRLALLTGARYAFVLAKREDYVEYLKDRGWRPVYETEQGCVFIME